VKNRARRQHPPCPVRDGEGDRTSPCGITECVLSCQGTMGDCCFNFRSGIGYAGQRTIVSRARSMKALSLSLSLSLCETVNLPGDRGTF